MRATITIAVLVCGVLLSAVLDRGSIEFPASPPGGSPLASASFSITSIRGMLSIRGTTVSARHELALRQLAADQLRDHELQTDFFRGVVTATEWEATSERLLYAVGAMNSADVAMTEQSITIRGVTDDAASFGARIEFLQELLPQQIEFVTDVIYVRSRASFDALCQKAFMGIVLEPVSFTRSSIEIGQASLATLDRITDFAHDCQNVTIAITGHTDSSGNEAWNRKLSLARAQSVADHIADNGIDRERLIVDGLGSSLPIADNSTVQGRQLNRRIEFELR